MTLPIIESEFQDQKRIRNIAIVAHVDHGKTTLVDAMLKQGGAFHARQNVVDRVMDRGDLERERGITILAKCTSITYQNLHINIVDTPGHADFGGEVERIVRMVDGVLLLIDAVDGPMPQTRFVLRKALESGLVPIVVINKIDRQGARPWEVVDETMELFIELGADEKQLDFPVIFANAREGRASTDPAQIGPDLQILFETIKNRIPSPPGQPLAPLQLSVTMIDYDNYVGRMAIGRIANGTIHEKQEVAVCGKSDTLRTAHITGLFMFEGLKRVPVTQCSTGQIVVLTGISDIGLGETITDVEHPVPLASVPIDAPTMSVHFSVNKSPFSGKDTEYVSSRKLRERLFREAESDAALHVEATDSPDTFYVSVRGELHLSILMETMRREGYEFEVSRPEVIARDVDGQRLEPFERVLFEVPSEYVGSVMEIMGPRHGQVISMHQGIIAARVEFIAPTRGLFGLSSEFLTTTKGMGTVFHSFEKYDTWSGDIPGRTRGSLVAFENGTVNSYGVENAQVRGELFVSPGDEVYRGMIVGENSRTDDLMINVCKAKRLTNMRSSTADIAVKLEPPRIMPLEACLEFINDDELLEVTPKALRMRKRNGA